MYLENTQPDICFVGRLNYDIQLHEFIDLDWVGSEDDKISATWICLSLSFATMSWLAGNKSMLQSTLHKQSILQLVMLVHKQCESIS
jgi:hypothetical protein